MHRWTCPRCESSTLGPERPRRDDVRRYCLDCSAKTGRLVERTCPVLDARRGMRAERAVARRSVEAARARDRHTARMTIAGLDVRELVASAWALPTVAEARREHGNAGRADIIVSKLTIRRRSDRNWTGCAWPALGRIVLSIPRDLPDETVARVRLRELVLHEVVHVALPPGTAHGPEFRRVMLGAIRDWWPGIVMPPMPRMTCTDDKLITALIEFERRMARQANPESNEHGEA